MTVPTQDPFANPAVPPSTFPSVASFYGRLIMVTAKKMESLPDNINRGQMKTRITADVTVLDGLGPVPLMKGNPPQPTGQTVPGPDFTGVWIESSRVVSQLEEFVGTGRPVLGVISLRDTSRGPGKGNPWSLEQATPEQRAQAVNFLNSRAIGGAAQPAPAPQVQVMAAHPQSPAHAYPVQGAPAYAAQAAPTPAAAPAAAPVPAVPQPGSAPAGANPFAAQAPAPQPAQVNPFAPQQ